MRQRDAPDQLVTRVARLAVHPVDLAARARRPGGLAFFEPGLRMVAAAHRSIPGTVRATRAISSSAGEAYSARSVPRSKRVGDT